MFRPIALYCKKFTPSSSRYLSTIAKPNYGSVDGEHKNKINKF
jgi:hypothetical protein